MAADRAFDLIEETSQTLMGESFQSLTETQMEEFVSIVSEKVLSSKPSHVHSLIIKNPDKRLVLSVGALKKWKKGNLPGATSSNYLSIALGYKSYQDYSKGHADNPVNEVSQPVFKRHFSGINRPTNWIVLSILILALTGFLIAWGIFGIKDLILHGFTHRIDLPEREYEHKPSENTLVPIPIRDWNGAYTDTLSLSPNDYKKVNLPKDEIEDEPIKKPKPVDVEWIEIQLITGYPYTEEGTEALINGTKVPFETGSSFTLKKIRTEKTEKSVAIIVINGTDSCEYNIRPEIALTLNCPKSL